MNIVIIPRTARQAVQSVVDLESILFSPTVWIHGVPEENHTDIERFIKLSADGARPATHLMVWGNLSAAKAQKLKDAGCSVYNNMTRRQVAIAEGLRPIGARETKKAHLFEMPEMHKIWDIADAPFPVLAGADTDLFNVLPGIAVSPKWDGYTCTVRYENGVLVEGITQGDCVEGLDRTAKLSRLVPATVSVNDNIQIEGEVITNRNKPIYAYRAIVEGTNRQFAALECRFLAFDVRGRPAPSHTAKMNWLNNRGFDTVLNYTQLGYPQDGVVYRRDDDQDPPEQFAFKFGEEP